MKIEEIIVKKREIKRELLTEEGISSNLSLKKKMHLVGLKLSNGENLYIVVNK